VHGVIAKKKATKKKKVTKKKAAPKREPGPTPPTAKRVASANRKTRIKKPPKETFAVSCPPIDNPTSKSTDGYRLNEFLAATRSLGDEKLWHITHIPSGCKVTKHPYKSANRALEIGLRILDLGIDWGRMKWDDYKRNKRALGKKYDALMELLDEE
jgi:hypothetical protein